MLRDLACKLQRGRSSKPSPPAFRLALLLIAAGAGLVQPAAARQGDGSTMERREARVLRTETPPVIDGFLEPEVWGRAIPIGELVQVEPVEGAPPTEASDIRLLYDTEHLYIGLRLYDREPSKIITTTRERDGFLDSDDRVEIVIDTFLDRRNAFFFQMNAGGSEGDALITNNGRNFNKPWDGIWEGKSRIDSEGWTAEIILPFKTLNFREGQTTWGFNIERRIGRRNERARWNSANINQRLFSPYVAGNLVGLEGIEQGIGLDLQPFFVGRLDSTDDDDDDLLGQAGFNAFYKVTPNLTLSLTYNTDFAETEVDQRRVNLTRFPLFFPERRDFFLQDSGLFEFGSGQGRSLIPFFSRRIGLSSSGEEVPLLGGAKITGRAGPWNIGVLNVQTEEDGMLDEQNLFSARISRNIGRESTLGTIVTQGDPEGGNNSVVGLDYNYRNSEFAGTGRVLTAGAFALVSDSDSEDSEGEDQYAWGANVSYPNDRWTWSLNFLEIQPGFDPALGFVPRKDIRRYSGSLGFLPRLGTEIRQLEFSMNGSAITDTSGELQTAEFEVQPFGIEFESGDRGRIEFEATEDNLLEEFEISDGVVIPAGSYRFDRARLELESAVNRDVSAEISVAGGEFFDGTRETYNTELLWQPGALFRGKLGYEINEIQLPGGSFDTRVAFVESSFTFNPDVAWNTILQWDNESNTYGVQSRLRWIPQPGREWILVWNQSLLDNEETRFSSIGEELAFKLIYTIRL